MTQPTEIEHDLMLESEVAAYLRCSTRTVRKLRLTGRLAYLPGKPVLIQRSDLKVFVETSKIASRHSVSNISTSAGASALSTREEAIEKGRRAFRMAQLRRDPTRWLQNAKIK